MEEYEKRRERLKAMRMEASQAGVNNAPETSGLPLPPGGLSNPLIESETVSTTPLQHHAPRFDYYTDPMAAFSGNRRTQGQYSRPPPPRTAYHGMAHSGPVHQYPAGQRTFQAPPTHINPGPPRGPMEAPKPFDRPQGNPRHAWGGSGGAFQYMPPPMYRGSPPPNIYGGSPPPNMCGGNAFASPSFGQGYSPVSHSRGRGQWHNSSPHYGSGRGGGRFTDSGRGRGRSGMNPRTGPSGRTGGGGSYGSTSAEQRPGMYYSKEMVEDPWKSLSPVVWKGSKSRDYESWLPKSISRKKTKVSPESSKLSIPQPSLAEYLAASFNESIKKTVDDEHGT